MNATNSMLSPTGFHVGGPVSIYGGGAGLCISKRAFFRRHRLSKCLLAYVFSPLLLGSPTNRHTYGKLTGFEPAARPLAALCNRGLSDYALYQAELQFSSGGHGARTRMGFHTLSRLAIGPLSNSHILQSPSALSYVGHPKCCQRGRPIQSRFPAGANFFSRPGSDPTQSLADCIGDLDR